MKPRPLSLTIPSGNARFVVLTLPGKGEHHFRLPIYGRCAELIQAVSAAPPAPPLLDVDPSTQIGRYDLTSPEWSAYQLGEDQTDGALLGVCWHHRGLALESVHGDESLTEYGEAVVSELMDHGYTRAEYHHLGAGLYRAMIAFFTAGRELQAEAHAEGKGSPAPTPTSST